MRRIFTFAALSLLAVSATASAQRSTTASAPRTTRIDNSRPPIELGMDGSLNFGLGGNNALTVFQLPISQVRAGFFVTPEWSIEPTIGFMHASANGFSTSNYSIGVGAPYHFSTQRNANQLYIRPFLTINGTSDKIGGVSTSDSYTEFGAGVGYKIPATDRLAWRIEGYLAHESKKVIDDSDNRLGLLFGLSYYTR